MPSYSCNKTCKQDNKCLFALPKHPDHPVSLYITVSLPIFQVYVSNLKYTVDPAINILSLFQLILALATVFFFQIFVFDLSIAVVYNFNSPSRGDIFS